MITTTAETYINEAAFLFNKFKNVPEPLYDTSALFPRVYAAARMNPLRFDNYETIAAPIKKLMDALDYGLDIINGIRDDKSREWNEEVVNAANNAYDFILRSVVFQEFKSYRTCIAPNAQSRKAAYFEHGGAIFACDLPELDAIMTMLGKQLTVGRKRLIGTYRYKGAIYAARILQQLNADAIADFAEDVYECAMKLRNKGDNYAYQQVFVFYLLLKNYETIADTTDWIAVD